MPDIIKLLSDNVANQIAAGEVVQRPASAVKELLENSIDAQATNICLIIKDAGKTLIQVIDNGNGMTETDARMSFERHATSKITSSNDLFSLKTKGFRGEALASIAAISQVEMQTKTELNELGTQITIEGSKIINQEPVACQKGTKFTIKNLFFNVPARRNFLKSNPVETKHIVDEFERVALTHPNIKFSMYHNDNEIFNLPKTKLRQRIINIFGKKINERLVPIEQKTNVVNILGYIIKPEFAKRTRGEQFFFVNNRFIKSSYLNHSIKSAYNNLIKNEQHPSYFIYLEIDPSLIDINIHPTKTEIKFEDERTIYAILNSTVKHSLGKYNIAPTLDFEQEVSFNVAPIKKGQEIKIPTIQVDTSYNPFKNNHKETKKTSFKMPKANNFDKEDIKANLNFIESITETVDSIKNKNLFSENFDKKENNYIDTKHKFYQLNNKYIITQVRSGLLIINQQRAHRRILYEQFLKKIDNKSTANSQKLIFPHKVELNPSDFALINDIIKELNNIGFEISIFGKNTLVVNGLPIGVLESEANTIVEKLLEELKNNSNNTRLNLNQKIALTMANSSSIKSGKKLEKEEMEHLFHELFSCESHNFSPSGKPIIIKINEEELEQRFEN